MTELNFRGKEFVYNHHLAVPHRPLEVHPDKGIGEPDLDGNLIVHGDNLHALKALLPTHAGRVDCVFIDPPYNTGNEGWSYSDNVSSPMIKEWLNDNPIDADDGLRHDKWCAMMWPRLRLLHELLSESGSLWMTLDDNEVHRARLLIENALPGGIVGTIIWRKNYAPKSSARHFSEDHDYVLVYARDPENWTPNLLPRTAEQNAAYVDTGDPRGPWRPNNLSARNYYSKGTYEIQCPGGRIIPGPPRGRYWAVSEERFKELDADDRIWWGEDGNNMPAPKTFLSEVKDGRVPQTFWDWTEVGHTQDAKKELVQIMDFNGSDDVFVTPKPRELIERVLAIATQPDSIVLDSFAGSGTTAHAVLKANARDGGDRRFVLVEMEDYADTLTAERVRRVIDGYDFTGTQREELLREKITWNTLKRADTLVERVDGLRTQGLKDSI